MPFTNRPYSNYLTDYLTEAHLIKASDFEPISIKAIEATAPFKVLSVEPPVPRKVGPEERVEFKIKIQGPDISYSGPMTLNFVEDNEDIIHLELTKVVLDYLDKKVEAENGLVMLNMPKNHIFQQDIQLLRILDYGVRIEKVSIDKSVLFSMAKLLGGEAGTVPMVKKVMEFKEANKEEYAALIEKINESNANAISAMEMRDWDAFAYEFEEGRRLTKLLGIKSNADIEPDYCSDIIDKSKENGALVAKLPGAGGMDSIVALCIGNDKKELLDRFWGSMERLRIMDVNILH